MKKLSITVAAVLMTLAGSAFAQNSTDGVTVSTDPAKAAAVERKAEEIKANQQATSEAKPAMHAKHHGKKHHAKHRAKKATAK